MKQTIFVWSMRSKLIKLFMKIFTLLDFFYTLWYSNKEKAPDTRF